MNELIQFVPVEILTCACFITGRGKKGKPASVDILSIVLIPCDKSGKVVVTELPFPEIFMQ